MNRFLIVIAVLFAFASLSGPTIARTMTFGHFWRASGSDRCLEPAAAHDEAPAFKPCGKKINAAATPCQTVFAVLPVSVVYAGEFVKPQFVVAQDDTPKSDVFRIWLRPPRG